MKSFVTLFISSLIVFSMLLFASANAQERDESRISVEQLRDLQRGSAVTVHRIETNVTGSPYLHDRFVDGFVKLRNGLLTEKLTMNYNILENRVEYSDGETIRAIEDHRIDEFSFEMGDRSILFRRGFTANGLEPLDFVRVLAEGNVTALLKYESSFREIPSYGQATRQAEFTQNQQLYIHRNGDTERVRRLSTRRVVNSLDSHRDEMRDFISQHNLDLSSGDDLERFFNHYNAISQ